MEIAVGIVFLALFTGALILFSAIAGFALWRRRKRRDSMKKETGKR